MIFVWVNKRDWRHPGPIVNVAAQNAHSLAALGHETHLVLGEGGASDTDDDLRSFYDLAPLPALTIHRIARRSVAGTASSLSIFSAARRLVETLARRDDVCVLTREGSFLPFLAMLCRHPRVRGYYEAHDFHADLSWHEDSPTLQEHKQSWLERLCLPRISGIIAIVAPQADLYAARFPNLPVISLPLGTTPRDPGDAEARRALGSLVYVGHLHASKGVSLLLRLARKCLARGASSPLREVRFLGGSEEQVARFRHAAAELGTLANVSFTPFLPPGELNRILSTEVSLGAVPLKDTFYNARLTCPAKALDYLAHGIPVLASDLPTTRDVLGSSASYVPESGAGPWFKAAKKILRKPARYHELSAAAWKRAGELAWPARARRLVDFVSQPRDR